MADKNSTPPPPMVFNVDLHCEGCAHKVRKCLKNFTGVKSVKTDLNGNRVTVVGNVESEFVKRVLEEKTKKKVEFQSLKSDAGAGKKSEKDEGKKAKEVIQQAPATVTVVLKTDVHCEGCATKMTKIVRKYKGVKSVNVDLSKDQIVVTGTMDMKQMLPFLNTKFKKTVELVPAPAAEKKPKGEDAKPATSAGDENGGKVDRMEYHGYPYSYGGVFYNHQAPPPPGNGYGMEYGNGPPAMQMPPASYLQAPQMFSDENPNACSVM